ncbi:hypothetical protein ILUMI_07673 [Ignelater luminosus]|uniref:Protein artemis n=1 Tax=Ignelater luminosus TaxID=2038154 RepID=A0A8K0D7M2_IGNLU|nr:hypothetical protein ILUMI_07673 [Ignelater luminosus]
MSTFDGKIEEIPEISVDRFDGENINSTVFFLSHCHADHMRGLDDWSFHNSLVCRPDVFLYASPISIRILRGLYPSIETKLKELPLGIPTLIKLLFTTNKCITVTLLPAGHCPGSVMFLFESEKTVLYSGDYRVRVSDLKKYCALYSLGRLKTIDKLYLDTTFCKKSFSKLPLRQESLENIYKIVEEWIKLSKKHIVEIALSARYGSEYLFLELAKHFDMPIHVSSETYSTYKYIPEMDKAVTVKGTETQIHAGCGGSMKRSCAQDNSLIRVIIPSTLWWENYNFSKGSMIVTEKGEYRVCYSCHASYEEIKDFVLFLQPKSIEPCVVPFNCKEKEIMLRLLEDIMKTYQDYPEQNEEVKLFEVLTDEKSNANVSTVIQKASEPVDDIPEDILGSPTKSFKRKRLRES